MGRTACLWSILFPKPGVSTTRTLSIVFVLLSYRSIFLDTSTCGVALRIFLFSCDGAFPCHASKSMLQVVVFPRPERPATMTLKLTTRGFSFKEA